MRTAAHFRGAKGDNVVRSESGVALEQSMHNNHAVAQIHPVLSLSTSRTVFKRLGFTRPNNRQRLQCTTQSIRTEWSAWSAPFFALDFDGCLGWVAICRLTFQRITDKRRPNAATPSVPWTGSVTTDVPQSSRINWIEPCRRLSSGLVVAVLLRVHLTKRLQYTFAARH